MEYNINLGSWKSVFAVPSEVVDKHLKLAGAAQLKVLLWFLRHSGDNFSIEEVSKALSMHEADVRDCMQYWVQTGIIGINGNEISPSQPTADSSYSETDLNAAADESTYDNNMGLKNKTIDENKKTNPADKKHIMSRPEKPDMKYLAQRMNSDESIAFMMQSLDEIFGRITNNNDKATLLMIHEYYGLPVEVLLMLLQYVSSIDKCSWRYIEKTAMSWADEEITTLEAAERKIQQLTNGRNAASAVQRIIGADQHSPTEKEIKLANMWINIWKFSSEMIRAAYELCVDNKGKYLPNYTNTILESWHNSGINSVEQIHKSKTVKQRNNKNKSSDSYEATYDISEYESTSVLDGEW